MNSTELAFVFHSDKCIQCSACEGACKIWRGVETGVKWRNVLNIWTGEYPNSGCYSVSLSCQHCVEPECEKVCPVGAITKNAEDGLVLVDSELCIGCQACFAACPFEVPQFGADGLMQKCDMCYSEIGGGGLPPCVRTCPTDALELRKVTAAQKAENESAVLSLLSGSLEG